MQPIAGERVVVGETGGLVWRGGGGWIVRLALYPAMVRRALRGVEQVRLANSLSRCSAEAVEPAEQVD